MSYSFGEGELSGTFGTGFDYPITLACYIKANPLWGSQGDTFISFSVADDSTNNSVQIRLGDSTTEDIRGVTTDNAGGDSASEYGFTNGTYDDYWLPLVGVFTNQWTRTIYVDSYSNSGENSSGRALTGTPEHFCIGRRPNPSAGFHGLIAECIVSRSTWSQAQIEAYMAGNVSAAIDANCYYYPLDIDDDTPSDQSGNGGPTLSLSGTGDYNSDHPVIGAKPLLLQSSNNAGF